MIIKFVIAFTHWNVAGSFVAVKYLAIPSAVHVLQRGCKLTVGLDPVDT